MQLSNDRRQRRLGYAFLMAVLSGSAATARYISQRSYAASTITQHHRPWGIQQKAAKISLPNLQQREVLDAYLKGIRGGSTDYYGDQSSNYYDRDGARDRNYVQDGGGRQARVGSAPGGYPDEDDYYDDRGRPSPSTSNPRVSNHIADIQSRLKNGDRRIGIPLLGVGAVFTMLGVSLFFNKSLMRLGNLFFIAGIFATLGPGRAAKYFLQPKKARATACLAAGIFLVFIGWPIFGMALEAFGILNLFGNMFPMLWAIVKNMPFFSMLTKNSGASSARNRNSGRGYDPDSDPYYEDRNGYDYGDDRGAPDSYY